jgi:hypothetical protein
VIKLALITNLTICGILYLRRYGNNLQSPKQTPALVMKPPLLLSTFLSTNEVRGNYIGLKGL